MVLLWFSWLLVSISMLFSSSVHTHPANLCIHSGSNSFRTWGPNCRRMCHCENEEPCDYKGYCANGCMHGWTRLTPNGSCSVRTSKNSSLNNTLFARPHYSNKNATIRFERNTFNERNVPMYRFSQDDTCIKDHTGGNTKFARLTVNPPMLIQEFAVIFNVKPRTEDITKVTFTLKNFENYSASYDLKCRTPGEPNVFSAENLSYVFVESITVAVTSMKASNNCSSTVINGFVLSGKPICPYGLWGLMCERTCHCPCGYRECHPSSGRCLERGLVCPANKFGQQCSSTCSSGCFGYPPECHALTGVCKECEKYNLTGVSCRSEILLEEEIQRNALCGRAANGTGGGSINASRSSTFDYVFHTNQNQKHRYRVLIIILLFLILFLLVCCSYVLIVQHCAKKRMKEQLISMEEARKRQSSMATYTEFKKEFMEMQANEVPSYPRSRCEQGTTSQNPQSTQQNITSQNGKDIPQTAKVEPQSLKAVSYAN